MPLDVPCSKTLQYSRVARLVLNQSHGAVLSEHGVDVDKLPERLFVVLRGLVPLFESAVDGREALVEGLQVVDVSGAAPDVKLAQHPSQGRLAVSEYPTTLHADLNDTVGRMMFDIVQTLRFG